MNLLKVVFGMEARQLLRQYWILGCLTGLIALSVLALLWAGGSVDKRREQEKSILNSYQEDLHYVLSLFGDTLSEKGRADAKLAGMVAMVNYRLPQPAVKEQLSLAPLSIGLTDVQPWYKMVKNTKSFDDRIEVPVSNPSILASGNYDYSLVLVYLLPLLVFAFSFSLYAAEKESGTLSLLTIQQGNAFHVIRMRLLFRFLLLLLTSLLTTALLFLLLSTGYGSVDFGSMLWWSGLTAVYLMFWFAVSYFILCLKKSAVITALIQISVWLFLAVILPGVVISYAQAHFPVPLKDGISSYRRAQAEDIWSMHPAVVSDSFNINNPEYVLTADPAIDTLPLSDRYIAGYYDLLERRMLRVIDSYQQEIDRRNTLIARLLSLNPVTQTEQLFTKISGNDLAAYRDFFEQADRFQKEWQGFLYPYHFRNEHLKPSDFYKFPVFDYRKPGLPYPKILKVMLSLLLSSLVLVALAERFSRCPHESTR
ncbi:ABC-2 type transport system permease protein [Algoriphagus sp. 4150]|uniref:DUF3526 domain-containing protein n=1 Tax=Algoriphagus sp. 4150 TaxID=2817756 RepID=UPI002862B592|nr:DUF3526 domain-containing protein [Algoriphagus sp. 4150]MDR7132568.1 ABC-2 type transport system permease protein [Algoriphagus sp. 4150]